MKKNYLVIILLLGLCACQKEVSREVSNTNTSAQVDVYVAGYESNDANNHYPSINPYHNQGDHPVYWKNGSSVQLNFDNSRPNDPIKSARAYSIAVSGNDVYVAGYQLWLSYNRGTLPMGVCWKNGVSLNRDSMNLDFTYLLSSLVVSNNDTYMVGWGTGNAGYWKNENKIALPENSLTLSIAVSGNDVYVAGASNVNGGAIIATYWKNGNPVNLTDGSKDANATSIAVSGSDVYVAGVVVTDGALNKAQYWKNGVLVNLTDGSTGADANSIAVSGTDVYVAGTQWDGNAINYSDGYTVYQRNPIAKYWKNGIPVNLTDGSKWAEAKSIVVSGNDVYVAGFEGSVAKYWKNGIPVILGNVSMNSEAYSIFLVKK